MPSYDTHSISLFTRPCASVIPVLKDGCGGKHKYYTRSSASAAAPPVYTLVANLDLSGVPPTPKVRRCRLNQ